MGVMGKGQSLLHAAPLTSEVLQFTKCSFSCLYMQASDPPSSSTQVGDFRTTVAVLGHRAELLFLWASIQPSPSTLPQPSQSPHLLLGPWASQHSLPSMRSSWPLFRAPCVDISPVLHLPRPGSALSQCRSFGGDTRTVKHNRAKSQGLHQFFKHEVSPSIHFQGQAFRKPLPGLASDIGYTKRENPK